jgi:hypothetical protein
VEAARVALEVVVVRPFFVVLLAGLLGLGFGLPGEVEDLSLGLRMLRLLGHVRTSRRRSVAYETIRAVGIFR